MISFTLSKLLSLLVYPLSMSLLLFVFALVFGRLRWDRSSLYTSLLAIGWLYLCSTALFANFLSGTLEREFVPRAMSVVEKADAIVLLGGAMRGDTPMGSLADHLCCDIRGRKRSCPSPIQPAPGPGCARV